MSWCRCFIHVVLHCIGTSPVDGDLRKRNRTAIFHARGVRGSGGGDRSEGMSPGLGAENLLDRQGGCQFSLQTIFRLNLRTVSPAMLVLFFAVHMLCAVRWNWLEKQWKAQPGINILLPIYSIRTPGHQLKHWLEQSISTECVLPPFPISNMSTQKGNLQSVILLKGDYVGFHASLGEFTNHAKSLNPKS